MGVYLGPLYQEVEYIQSSGTQYINTGFIPSNNTKVELSMGGFNSSTTSNSLFGARAGWSTDASVGKGFGMSVNATNYNYGGMFGRRYNSGDGMNVFSWANGGDYILALDQSGFYQDGVKKFTPNTVTFTSPVSMYIFALNDNGTLAELTQYKLYYFKIWNGGTLVRDFVPCYRKSDNVIGVFDKVENKFYTNAGSGTFTKGNDVRVLQPELKNAYIGEVWTPNASRTLLYLPLESNATDQSGNNRSTTQSGLTYGTYGGVVCAYNSGSGYINLTTSAADYLVPSSGEATANIRIYRGANETTYNRCIFEWQVQNKIGMNFNVLNSTYYPRYITTGSSDKGGAFGTTSIPLNTWTNLCLRIKNGSAECFLNGQYVGVQSSLNNNGFGAWSRSDEQGCYLLTNRGANSNGVFKGGAREFIYENTYWSNEKISNYYLQSKTELGI